ncbi:uncharacterized protein cubi_03296 [Cryptosporidium ubiquitum]|uniref:Uncharacterized protein n=1 Tax=Cryptosporidium ubiquitum TaxID=857276 RepID=A0A1J4ME97_9CRYT|nr:uncharacterized protein cubi_03296 [Cryptosporidium ubiquitum]OII72560.1 hypothetical protein cubi_03296 [Cryptosporidium ubiquitum]
MQMGLGNENKYKGIKIEWNSEEVIPYIKGQLAEIRNNALKTVEEAFSGINDTKNNDLTLFEVERKKSDDLRNNPTKEDAPPLKCSQLELLKFLKHSNDKLSKYNIGTEKIHFVNT